MSILKIFVRNWEQRWDRSSKRYTGWDTALKDKYFSELVGRTLLLFIVMVGVAMILHRVSFLKPLLPVREVNSFLVLVVVSGIFYLLLQELVRDYHRQARRQIQFLSDASHELRTPLTIMRTELEISLRHPGTVEENIEGFKNVLSEVKRMQKIVEDLLTLSRLETNKKVIQPERVNAVDLLEQLTKSMNSFAKSRNVTIVTNLNIPPKYRHVVGSYDQLLQALRNLVKNAIEYSKPEGGRIHIEAGKGRLSDHNMLVVRIADEGIGISQKDLAHVFNRFYQVNKSRALEQGKGSGLGLAIAHWIITSYQGELMLASKLGVGTTAIVRLRRYDKETPLPTSSKRVSKPPKNKQDLRGNRFTTEQSADKEQNNRT